MLFSSLISSNKEFVDISKDFSVLDFEKTKNFILDKGDRRFYRNYDNNNPHYDFEDFQAYLNAEIGQKNLDNDPEISNFNEITIYNSGAEIQYYTIRIVRQGDIEHEDIDVDTKMIENHVYLMNTYEKQINKMKSNLLNVYLPKIKLIVR